MARQLPQTWKVSEGDEKVGSVNYTDILDGESLTGTPTVTHVSPTPSDSVPALTISNISINNATVSILGDTVLAGKALQFKFKGMKAGIKYILRLSVTTNGTPPQVHVFDQVIQTES
jgi:hypothetical protein